MREYMERWWCEHVFKGLKGEDAKPEAEDIAFLRLECEAVYKAGYEDGMVNQLICEFSEPDRCAARRYNHDVSEKLKATEKAYWKLKDKSDQQEDEIAELKTKLEEAKKEIDKLLRSQPSLF